MSEKHLELLEAFWKLLGSFLEASQSLREASKKVLEAFGGFYEACGFKAPGPRPTMGFRVIKYRPSL